MGCSQSTDAATPSPNSPQPQEFTNLERTKGTQEQTSNAGTGARSGRYANAGGGGAANVGSSSPGAVSLPSLHRDIVFSLALGPSDAAGVSFFAGSEDRSVSWFVPAEPKPAIHAQHAKAHSHTVTDMVYARASRCLFTASRDRTLRSWAVDTDAHTLAPLQTFTGHTLPVSCVDVPQASPTRIVSGSRDYQLRFWDVETAKCLFWPTEIQQNIITDVKWLQGEECVLQASEDLSLRVWDARTKDVVQTFQDGPYFALYCGVSSDNNYFVTGHNGFEGVGCEVKLFDRRAGKKVVEVQVGRQAVTALCFLHPSGSDLRSSSSSLRVASATKDSMLKIWDLDAILAAGEAVALADKPTEIGLLASVDLGGQEDMIQSLAAGESSATGRVALAAGHFSGRVSVWQINEHSGALSLQANAPGASAD